MSHSSRIIDGLKTATNYSFYVRAKNKCGNWSAVSAAVSHTTLADTTVPAVLSAITLQMLDGFFLLKWAKPTTLDLRSGGYKVYVYTANTAASAKLIREVGYTSDSTQIFIGEKTQDVAITITAGTTYYFWVTTLDASGNESAKVATTPTSGAVTASGTALDHGALGDLLADDHTQYVKADGTRDIVQAGEFRIGDGTNYAQFAADGEITLAGTGRVEKEIIIPLDGLGKGATAPALVRLGSFVGYEFDIGDDGYFSFEVPDNWASGTNIEVLIHWYCNEAYALNSGEVKWQGIYACVPEGGGETVDAPTHTATITTGDINIPATAKHLIESTMAIPAAAISTHDVIGILFSRVALTAGTDPTAKPTVIHLEIEYIADKLGIAT